MKIISFSCLLIILFCSCGEHRTIESDRKKIASKVTKTISKGKNPGFLFSDKGFVLNETEEIHSGTENIEKFYADLLKNLNYKKIEIIHQAGEIKNGFEYFYELGKYVFKENQFIYLCKWIKQKDKWLKEFELISKKGLHSELFFEIEDAKERIITASYNKNNEKTINELYHKDAYYWNNNILSHGHTEIIKAWGNYGFAFASLKEKAHIVINNTCIYEIGQYNNADGHSGLYILMWEKRNGIWKAVFDSNI